LRVFNQKEDVELNIVSYENRKFSEVCIVRSFTNNIENLIVGTDRGQIKVYPMPPILSQDVTFDSFNAHIGEVSKLVTSPDGRYVFSSGTDGSIFVFSVTEYANDNTVLKQEIQVSSVKEEQAKLET
jgi:WD40 repeat protein